MVDRNMEKLQELVHDEVTRMFEKILDYAEVAVPNGEQYRKLRSKVLRVGNNCSRNINKEIEKSYTVTFRPSGETIIEVFQKKRA